MLTIIDSTGGSQLSGGISGVSPLILEANLQLAPFLLSGGSFGQGGSCILAPGLSALTGDGTSLSSLLMKSIARY